VRILFLLAIGTIAMCWDLWKGKIPNILILSGLCCGWCYQMAEQGMSGIPIFLKGMMLPLLLLAPLYFFRMIGAGDIKLFAVIGGFIGIRAILMCMAFSFLVGAVISVFLIFRRRILSERLHYFFAYISNYFQTKQWTSYRRKQDVASQIHFSVPIFISILFYIGGIY